MAYFRYLWERTKQAYADAQAFREENFGGAIVALLVSVVGGGYVAYTGGEPMKNQWPSLIGAGVVGPVALVCAAFVIFWFFSAYRIYKKQRDELIRLRPAEKHSLDYTIRLTAEQATMPDRVLPEGMNVFRIHNSMGGVGLQRTLQAPGSLHNWPKEHFPQNVVQCVFENFSNTSLLDIEADLEILIQESVPTQNGSQSGKVIAAHPIKSPHAALKDNAQLSFFVSNETADYGLIRLPETCRIKQVGSDEWEIIRLAPPHPFTYGVLYPFIKPNQPALPSP